jgi:glyoxylase-like metal-dependent hydrolase (beta-lactamase superfamily II)
MEILGMNKVVSKSVILALMILLGLTKAYAAQQSLDYSDVKFHVFTSEDDGFFVNSVIVEGTDELLLVDAQLTRANALEVLKIIKPLNKDLKKIYITHEHPDHFLGLEVFKDAFPDVKVLANSKVADGIEETYRPKIDKWRVILGERAATREVSITRFDENEIRLGATKIQIYKHLQGDTEENSYLWFPKERVAIVGDLVYKDMHLYAMETTRESRKLWVNNLDELAQLRPSVVIPGHSYVNVKFDSYSAIDFTKQYLSVFDQELVKSTTASEFKQRMRDKYPDAALFFGVDRAAAKFFDASIQQDKSPPR